MDADVGKIFLSSKMLLNAVLCIFFHEICCINYTKAQIFDVEILSNSIHA